MIHVCDTWRSYMWTLKCFDNCFPLYYCLLLWLWSWSIVRWIRGLDFRLKRRWSLLLNVPQSFWHILMAWRCLNISFVLAMNGLLMLSFGGEFAFCWWSNVPDIGDLYFEVAMVTLALAVIFFSQSMPQSFAM